MVDPSGLLMIEPSSRVSPAPIIDALTRMMTAAWRERRHREEEYNGKHQCACGAMSDCADWLVGAQPARLTNSLCIHYLAYHRSEVPAEELEKVRALNADGVEPTPEELRPPPPKRAERLARVPHDLRDWLASVHPRYGTQHETALDTFLNVGSVTFEIEPSRLPVPEAALPEYCCRLEGVWIKPFGDAFGGTHTIRTTVEHPKAKGSATVRVRIEVWHT